MAKVTVILGSPKKSSRLNGVVIQTIMELEKMDLEVELIPLYNLPAEDLLHANFNSEAIRNANQLVEEADALIIATPVYKAAYSGILKSYLDMLPQNALQNKIILPMVMGGTNAHLLMIEYALKPVVSVLGVTQIENGVYIKDSNVAWNDKGTVDIEPTVNERLLTSISNLVQKLSNNIMV